MIAGDRSAGRGHGVLEVMAMIGATETSGADLVRSARAGDASAREALIARYWDRSHAIAYAISGDSHGAEDITQEVMLSLPRRLDRFDPDRPFEPWLHRVVTNRALDWVRARSRRGAVPIGDHPELADPAAGPGEDPDLVAALGSLKPDHRVVVVLRHVAGYGPDEIAEMLDLPRGTVGSRLRRGLDQLRTELEGR